MGVRAFLPEFLTLTHSTKALKSCFSVGTDYSDTLPFCTFCRLKRDKMYHLQRLVCMLKVPFRPLFSSLVYSAIDAAVNLSLCSPTYKFCSTAEVGFGKF